MDVDSSTACWLDIALRNDQQDIFSASQQNETIKSSDVVENPIYLFERFVSVVSSDFLKGMSHQLEFSTLVRHLCIKAPSVAEYLVREILHYTSDNAQPKAQDTKESGSGVSNRIPRNKQQDRTYQVPRSLRTQPEIPRNDVEDSNTALEGEAEQHGTALPEIDKKASKTQARSTTTSDAALEGLSLISDESVTCHPDHTNITINQSSNSPTTEKPQPLRSCEGDIQKIVFERVSQEGVQGQPAAHIHTTGLEPALPLLKAMDNRDRTTGNAAYRQSPLVIDDSIKNSQTTGRPPSLCEAEQQETVLPEIDEEASDAQVPSATSSPRTEEHETCLSDSTPSTPVRQTGNGFRSPLSDDQTDTPNTTIFTPTVNGEVQSPLTEDNGTASPPDKVEVALLEGILSSPSSSGQQQARLSHTASTQAQQVNGEQLLRTQDHQTVVPSAPFMEASTLSDMVAKAVHLMYKISRRPEVPTNNHSRILSALQPSLCGSPASSSVAERADSILNTSSSTHWSASMWISMLEAGQARSREATILHMIELMGASEWYDTSLAQAENAAPLTKRGKPRKRLATIVLDEYLKEARENPGSKDNKDGIQKRILDARRKKLNNDFHKGGTLRKLVQMTDLGILFDPNIWSYAKASKELIDKVAALFQADPPKMELLSILGEQVELLVRAGRPDLSRFFDSLESHSIAGSEEISSLRAVYGLESEPLPQGYLDAAINRVVERISHDLDKQTLSDDDSMIVNGAVELSCGVFDRLRSREWLHCWDIAAALEMTDRPVFVKLGLSIPLHKKDANGGITPHPNPLRRWRTTIDDHRGKNDLEGPLVYFCPLNLNGNHFTLLEINERTQMIYHYDSMASHKIICRKTKATLVRRVVEEEFKYLNFGYTEAPTPQQKDSSSCGLMVIRNAKQRMSGLPVGTWNDVVDPDRIMKDVVRDCEMYLENDTLQPSSLSKKRKNNALEPSRISKRLKQLSEGFTVAP